MYKLREMDRDTWVCEQVDIAWTLVRSIPKK